MKAFHLTRKDFTPYATGVQKEWVMTNGIGGYAGSSVTGAHSRLHHGYLIASLHPPVKRYVVLSKISECFSRTDEVFDFTTDQYQNAEKQTCYTDGLNYLTDFIYDGLVHFHYEADQFHMKKTLAFEYERNTIAIAYDIENNGAAGVLRLTPLFNFRVHNNPSRLDDLQFIKNINDKEILLIPTANSDVCISLYTGDGKITDSETLFSINMQLQKELDVETEGIDCHYMPYWIDYEIPANSRVKISVVCSLEEEYGIDAFAICEAERNRLHRIEKQAGYTDELANALSVAADQFLAYRQSTGLTTVLAGLPWFTDWGRDTMIALTGLVLSTHRYDKAREILSTFAAYVSDGLVPNMFPDIAEEPLYNTADASMWYFYAVDKYLSYTGEDSDFDFVKEEIYPKLKEIIHAYEHGTSFSIYMEKDGLIHAGSGLDQVTWMDVRVGNWVATPRHGKPVEINALWYNALCVMEKLSARYGEDSSHYHNLAAYVKVSFRKKFWNETEQCLYDVVDDSTGDPTIRPNQIYAVSLPYRMLDADQEKKVVDKVSEKLYAGTGLRSLSPDDPAYHPTYEGCLDKRDHAYHQGTSWGFLLGGFLTAYIHVYGTAPDVIKKADEMLDPVRSHLYQGCIGSVSEIFDGDAPHTCRGCYAQAWSVGEILRAYTEDILPNRP